MSIKLVVPRDPLIFRDGKPFTAVPGERAKSIPFPFPATLAGAVRTREGTDPSTGIFEKSQSELKKLKELSVRGPFLVELDDDGKIIRWYFSAPADALLISKDGTIKIHSLAPLQVENGISDLDGKLKLLGAKEIVKDKPMKEPPLYWDWELVQAWLLNPDGEFDLTNAIQGLKSETRTHVSIDKDTKTAVSGALFQTSGKEFVKRNKNATLSQARQLALAVETSAAFANGVDSLGGERRVIRWESSDEALPACPPEIKKKIVESGHCRLMLATPGSFDDDFVPVKLKEYVEAVALPRYQTISGWDYAAVSADGKPKGAPKPTRRLAPAGSVYFLNLEKVNDIKKFIEDIWLNKSISDDVQSQRDGFGLALLGAWDGTPRKLEVKHG